MNNELIPIINYIMINNEIHLSEKRVVNCYEEERKIKFVYEDGTYTYMEIKHK